MISIVCPDYSKKPHSDAIDFESQQEFGDFAMKQMTRVSFSLLLIFWIRKYSALFVACLYLTGSYAQLPPASFHHLKSDERLLSSAYHCLAEDRYGFIWFGSLAGGGLYRFDGYDLKSFAINPDKPQGVLPSGRINSVFSFGGDELYVGTQGGLAMMNVVSGEAKHYLDNVNDLPDVTALYVEPIALDSMHQRTWIGTKYGLFYLDWSTDTVLHIPFPPADQMKQEFRSIIDLIIDNENPNLLWLATDHGLFSYLIDQNKFAEHEINKVPAITMDIRRRSRMSVSEKPGPADAGPTRS
jgi:ligand-binding sensor domain-containing protein